MQPLNHVIIAGGGAAGWMTAAGLAHKLKGSQTKITLIESEEIGIIGVGEASIPQLALFNQMLGINEPDFVRATKGTFKLGIEFKDWLRLGHAYLHPFGTYGHDVNNVEFHHYWLRAKAEGAAKDYEDLGDFNLNTIMARTNRFTVPNGDPKSPLSTVSYAYHFDASLYAKFLRHYAEARGVVRLEGKITEVLQDSETGNIIGLNLDNGRDVKGDFFVDCTGMRALLIGHTLKVGYRDWRQHLPCNRAVAVPCENTYPLTPYTRSTAKASGWQWRIPLQHRTGNGYVYSSDHISDQDALDSLMNNLDGKALADPRLIPYTPGRRERAWEKNCVSIGLSCGFLEPLESTAIHLIQKGVTKLIRHWPNQAYCQALVDSFNRETAFEYEDVRDFLILHYKATERNDSPFWNEWRTRDISDSLNARIELFKETGRIFINGAELFKRDSWLAVMVGQGIVPHSYDPFAKELPQNELRAALTFMRDTFTSVAAKLPSQDEFLKHHRLQES